MKPARANHKSALRPSPAREQAGVRVGLLVLAFFILGVAAGIFWFDRATKHAPAIVPGARLSDGTVAVLKRLDAPVEIRFYSLLDPGSVNASLQAYAARADQLLAEFERAAAGRIKLTRYNTRSDTAASAASADGIKPFNLDKGDACYLGLAVSCSDQKESLPQLSPDWEPALEFDLGRAIARVAAARPGAKPAAANATAPTDTALAEVKRAIPNLASVTVAEGTRILREAALKDFAQAARDMETKIKEARDRLTQVQSSGSAAEQQTAMQQLQQAQSDQNEKLKEVAARLQAQIAALEKLKKQ